MTGNIVNLRLARKRKAREDDARQADQNRVKFGRTKAEKAQRVAIDAAADRHLDGHKITRAADSCDPSTET